MTERYKSLFAILIFVLMQAAGGVALVLLPGSVQPSAIGLIVIATGLLTVVILHRIGLLSPFPGFARVARQIRWSQVPSAVLAAFLGIFASNLMSELLDLPDLMAGQFQAMAHTFWGILSMTIVGPVVEELVFREAVLGHLLRHGVRPWPAMAGSALAFGIVHANPVQIPFAIVCGLLFAIIYYKTGNILLTSLIHVVNNSTAVAMLNVPKSQAVDFSYVEMWGQTGTFLVLAVCTILSVCLMCQFWHKYRKS